MEHKKVQINVTLLRLSVKIMVFTVHLLLVYFIQLCMGIKSAGHYINLMFVAESSEKID